MTAPPPGDPTTIQIEPSQLLAVVDTNVLLDIYSCHDVSNSYEQGAQIDTEAFVDSGEAVYRRARARESLILAMYFHAASDDVQPAR